MKLDKSVVEKIMEHYGRCAEYDLPPEFENFLKTLDLVFKPGDSSQATLVESEQ